MKTQGKQEYHIGIEMERNTREAIRLISISLNRSRHRRNKKDRAKMRLFKKKYKSLRLQAPLRISLIIFHRITAIFLTLANRDDRTTLDTPGRCN